MQFCLPEKHLPNFSSLSQILSNLLKKLIRSLHLSVQWLMIFPTGNYKPFHIVQQFQYQQRHQLFAAVPLGSQNQTVISLIWTKAGLQLFNKNNSCAGKAACQSGLSTALKQVMAHFNVNSAPACRISGQVLNILCAGFQMQGPRIVALLYCEEYSEKNVSSVCWSSNHWLFLCMLSSQSVIITRMLVFFQRGKLCISSPRWVV